MALKVFSKRHPKLAAEVYLKYNVRLRIWYYMEECDPLYDNNWTMCWDGLPERLMKEHGWEDLRAYKSKNEYEICNNIKDFILRGVPRFILDACELFNDLLVDYEKQQQIRTVKSAVFQQKINTVFEDASLPWRMLEGRILKVDSKWLETEILAKAAELMTVSRFEGALEEFLEARSDLMSGDHKDAIHTANLALESTIKGILNVKQEKPGVLFKKLVESGIIPDYHHGFIKAFEEHILRSVSMARNFEKGVGHGQGSEVNEPPKSLAELAVNLSGVLIIFLIKHYLEQNPSAPVTDESEPEQSTEFLEDDIPF